MSFIQKTTAFLLLLLSPCLAAQEYLFDVQSLTTEDGLANLMTTAIYRDDRGFIWVGTSYGLNRYDGYQFKLFTAQNNGLHTNQNLVQIREDDQGRLWLFYREGFYLRPVPEVIQALDIFDPKTGRAVPFNSTFSEDPPFEASQIYLPQINDPRNRLWIHTDKGELYLHQADEFKKVFHREGTFFEHMAIDDQENIWLAWKNTLLLIDLSGQVLEETPLPGMAYGLWAAPDGMIYLATKQSEGQQLDFWRKARDQPLAPFHLTRDGQAIFPQTDRPFLHLDQHGYWLVKVEEQLQLFDTEGDWLYNYSTQFQKGFSPDILSYQQDDSGLWLTSSTGILRVSVGPNPFRLIHKKENRLSDCRGITEDEGGNIYFLNSDILHWNVNTKICRKVAVDSVKGAAYVILYRDSTLWAGTYGVSPMGFEVDLRTNGKIDYQPLSKEQFLVYSVAPTDLPDRFLVGLNHGIAYLDLSRHQLLPYTGYRNREESRLLEQSQVNYIHRNTAGFWLATDHGVFLLDERESSIRHFHKSNRALPFDNVRHIYEDEAGVFWLSTRGGGIIRWLPTVPGQDATETDPPHAPADAYLQLTTEDGLADNFTYAIYEDDFNKLWIPSDQGLMQMDKTSFRIRTFTTDDGLPHNEFNHNAHYQDQNGALYFGGLGGLITFHPRNMTDGFSNAVPLQFIHYHVLEEHADKVTDRTRLLAAANTIEIAPQDKFIELHFTLLDYDTPTQHRYAYQIEGYSDRWNYIDENFIRITHLPYGDYTLRIRGQNLGRGWSEQELSLGVRVLKPFYLQFWFIALLGLVVAGSVLFVFQWRIRELKSNQNQLELEVQKRTRQIEADKETIAAQAIALQELNRAKSHFFSNITHEFRTPLTLIIGPAEQLLKEKLPPASLRRLSGIAKNARQLLTLINQLLDLSKLESGKMKSEIDYGDIVDYTRGLVRLFQPWAEQKEQRLAFVSATERWETHFDRSKWDKIIFNLTTNAIKYTPKGGAVQLSLSKAPGADRECIKLIVKDTGSGIEENQRSRIFDRFYQIDTASTRAGEGTGIGLALVKELVEIQGGEIEVVSTGDQGASFEVKLPVSKAVKITATSGPSSEWEPTIATFLTDPQSVSTSLHRDHQSGEKLELLIVEDNREMREFIRDCVDEEQYRVTEAVDGQEGLEIALELIPDLIISDVMMPRKDGFALTRAIRDNVSTSHIPLILLTAKTSLESRLQGLRRGADAYLTKPFSPEELSLRVEKFIELRRLLQHRYQAGRPSVRDDRYRQEDEFITQLRDYVLQHLDETDLNGDRIGKHFGMSRVHLYRKLKALTDQPISEFVKNIRLEKALELVRKGELNVSEIAWQTGFSSLSYFSISFKKAFGKNPSEM